MSRWKVVLGAVVVVLGLGAAAVVAVPRVFGDGLEMLVVEDAQGKGLAWSPDGDLLASVGSSAQVVLRDSATGEPVRTLQGEFVRAGYQTVAWSPDGDHIVAGGEDDDNFTLWDVATGEVVRVFEGHTDRVRWLAWSPDSSRVASASSDATVRVWDVATGETVHVFEAGIDTAGSVAWSPDGTVLATGGSNKWPDELGPTLKLWDPVTGKLLHAIEANDVSVRSVVWSPDGEAVATTGRRSVDFWDPSTGELLRTFGPEESGTAFGQLAGSPDGAMLASADGGMVELWDLATGEVLETFDIHADADRSSGIRSIAWSPDGTTLAIGGGDVTIRLWNIEDD